MPKMQPQSRAFLVPAPVKVKTPRVRVDFDGDAVLHAGFENLVDIDLRNPRRRWSCRPVMWPMMVVRGFLIALSIRSICSFFVILKRAMHACDGSGSPPSSKLAFSVRPTVARTPA
jgi:hypothetical protein